MATIIFHVTDRRTAAPLAGASLHAESPWGPWNGVTNAQGDFAAELGAAHYTLTISKPGYTTLTMGADLEYPGTVQLALEPIAAPVMASALNGIDAFLEFRYWLDGNTTALAELREERQACGFTMARVFMAGSKSQNGVLELSPFEPRYREQLRPFAQSYADHGEYLLATMGVDYQIQCPDHAKQLEVWQWMGEAFQGLPVLLSACNEGDKNGVDGSIFPAIPGVACSRGSLTQDLAPLKPELDFSEFHQRRNHPNRETDIVASAIYLLDHGYVRPQIMSEAIPFAEGGDGSGQSSDARLAWRLGRGYGTWWSGAVFHNRFTQFGRLMEPTTRACAEAWSDGMQTVR